jgi:probable O-glycosylation ligase (exosortase A-associated)
MTLQTGLQISMLIWVCCTTLWAQVPDAAWTKWDWAFKTMAFATFIPYVIRSRVQIEAFAQTYVLSLAANFIPYGVKVMISGGGYGVNLGLQQGNGGLAEGGLLSTACLMAVPLAMYLAKHSQLMPKTKLLPFAYWGVALLAIITALGTYERSAVLGLGVLGVYRWIRTKHKLGFGMVLALGVCVMLYVGVGALTSRASIEDYHADNSAYVRVLVWQWTLEFTATHPFGGGFVTYLINHVDVPENGAAPAHIEFGRAFHSSYFEILGEHGYPGLIMFLTLAVSTFVMLRRIGKKAQLYPELEWMSGLSDALQSGLAVFLTSGAFVGLAFQPMFWYFISMSICLNAYLYRAEQGGTASKTGWRAMTSQPNSGRAPSTGASEWRKRGGRPG